VGIPLAIYVDLKSLYVSPKSLRGELNGEGVEPEWLTHFSRACEKLGIEVIKAYSPQAKGRVERKHAVYQDRLVKELKLNKIRSIEEANAFLSNGFINDLNNKFAKEAADPGDAHVALSAEDDLDQIFCWEYSRQVKNDWTVQFENRCYQLEQTSQVRPKQSITVRKHLDGSISLWIKETRLSYCSIEIEQKEKEEGRQKVARSVSHSTIARSNKHKTPWGRYNPDWLKGPLAREKRNTHLPTGSTS